MPPAGAAAGTDRPEVQEVQEAGAERPGGVPEEAPPLSPGGGAESEAQMLMVCNTRSGPAKLERVIPVSDIKWVRVGGTKALAECSNPVALKTFFHKKPYIFQVGAFLSPPLGLVLLSLSLRSLSAISLSHPPTLPCLALSLPCRIAEP